MAETTETEEKKEQKLPYITLWFDEKGELKFKSLGVGTYLTIGILVSALVKFLRMLGSPEPLRPSGPPPESTPEQS